MKDHTCLLNHHQRSHCDTITIGLEGMMKWVLQLNNSQLEKLVQQSLGEAPRVKLSKPTQSKPIEDRTGKPVTQEIVGKLQEELSSSDRPGKPEQLLQACLPYWMCVQSSFNYRQWIDTWRSKIEQETDSILLAC